MPARPSVGWRRRLERVGKCEPHERRVLTRLTRGMHAGVGGMLVDTVCLRRRRRARCDGSRQSSRLSRARPRRRGIRARAGPASNRARRSPSAVAAADRGAATSAAPLRPVSRCRSSSSRRSTTRACDRPRRTARRARGLAVGVARVRRWARGIVARQRRAHASRCRLHGCVVSRVGRMECPLTYHRGCRLPLSRPTGLLLRARAAQLVAVAWA